ncbi:uncharacterized protein [Lepeophtheirus salmonis]|uniref:uncharacterized protein n=1 Tax=Lepeophtheirus salmonis TaxID=72036 RepID=UPI003AF33B36
MQHCLENYPKIALKYYFQIQKIIDTNYKEFVGPITELRPWQEIVINKINNQNDRQILFVIDEDGNKGKSTLIKHLVSSQDAWACTGGKVTDLMTAYDTDAKIAIFDMARSNPNNYWSWSMMENLKNGIFTTTKYKGMMKQFTPPKVVVFTNKNVPRDKFSMDRYDVYFI